MSAKHVGRLQAVFCLPLIIVAFWGIALAETIMPAQEQEFTDAKAVLETARKMEAGKYAPEPFTQAADFLQAADNARRLKDAVAFSRASRLARAYADLAKASTELNTENAKLAATREELKKAKAEIERLQKLP